MVSEISSSTSDDWRRALRVADTVKRTAQGLRLEPRSEWLRQVIGEAAAQMRAAVLWAASQGSRDGKLSEGLRQLVVAADAVRSDAALASYFFNFLSHEHLITEHDATMMARDLNDIELAMDALSRRLRTDYGLDPYNPSVS